MVSVARHDLYFGAFFFLFFPELSFSIVGTFSLFSILVSFERGISVLSLLYIHVRCLWQILNESIFTLKNFKKELGRW